MTRIYGRNTRDNAKTLSAIVVVFCAVVAPSPVLLDDHMVADDLDLITTKLDDYEYFSAVQLAVVPCCLRGTACGPVTACGTLVCMFIGLIGLVCFFSRNVRL